MYQLFQFDSRVTTGAQRHPSWDNISRGLELALNVTETFYRGHTYSVKADHILSKIIARFGPGENESPTSFYLKVMSDALAIARTLKLTSIVQPGVAWPGEFYGPGVKEVLIASTDAFDYNHVAKNWERTQAVKVLSHPITNLGFDLPDGLNNGTESGVAVIEINIPMLLIQYQAFRRSEKIRKESLDLPERTTYQFIHRFVLPNMLLSHIQHVLINRVRAMLYEEPFSNKRPTHSFKLVDWSKDVERFHHQLTDYLRDKTFNVATLLHAIPLLHKQTAKDTAKLTGFVRTQQIRWALALSRLDYLEIIAYVSTTGHGNTNLSEFNQLQREFDRYKSERTLTQVMPKDLYNQTLFRWERLERLVRR